jgi:5'-methylthioadenosine phosphorylase
MAQEHLAIIGGTGLYELDSLKDKKSHSIETPFGEPSGNIIEGRIGDQKVLFLPRHGIGHRLLPHEVNYRANIWALKKLGARSILSISATGSLREDFKPGDMALVSQYFDHTRGKRDYTFFGNGIVVLRLRVMCIWRPKRSALILINRQHMPVLKGRVLAHAPKAFFSKIP